MTTLTIDLPDHLAITIEQFKVSDDSLNAFISQAIESWLATGKQELDQVEILINPKDQQLIDVENTPTWAEMWAELDRINAENPIELDIPERKDRLNPLLDEPDEFFV